MSAKKSKPKPDDKEQSARFIETAERIGVVNANESFDFDDVVKRLLKISPKKKSKKLEKVICETKQN